MPSSLLQVVDSLFLTCQDKQEKYSSNTTCEQICYNLFVDLQQLVRRYVMSLTKTSYTASSFVNVN